MLTKGNIVYSLSLKGYYELFLVDYEESFVVIVVDGNYVFKYLDDIKEAYNEN